MLVGWLHLSFAGARAALIKSKPGCKWANLRQIEGERGGVSFLLSLLLPLLWKRRRRPRAAHRGMLERRAGRGFRRRVVH